MTAWTKLKKNKPAIFSFFYIIFLVIASFTLPSFLTYEFSEQEIWNKHSLPNFGQSALVIDDAWVENFSPKTLVENYNFSSSEKLILQAKHISSQGVILNWEPIQKCESYKIYRSIDEENVGLPMEELPREQVEYLDTNNIEIGEKYFYRISCVENFTESEPSDFLMLKISLTLNLSEARKFSLEAKIGETVETFPHYLGTDYLGRDLLSRLFAGAQVSLTVGLLAPLIYILIGVIYGSLAGYFGGMTDNLMMRFADMVYTIPELLTVIMLQVFLGSGLRTLIIAMVISTWANSARQIRGEVLRIKEFEFVHASRSLGAKLPRIMFRHLIPNMLGTILVLFTLAIPQAIFTEAFLSFVGLGISPPLTSWGTITREGAKVFLTYPHELIFPASFICVTMLAFNILGDGLRDALDSKLND